ncbi:MAG TPA: hypothetical protein PKM21_18980 [Anaerolineales bacterium]|nr:hypothetical protein [Anaerolineales bacterium]
METHHHPKVSPLPGRMLCLFMLFLVTLGAGGCGGWHLEFSTPVPHPAPCPIQELLLDVSVLPGDNWQEMGEPSEKSAPVRMGIEKIGTSFLNPTNSVLQGVYRFEGESQARSAYRESVESWFTTSQNDTKWAAPDALANLVVNADRYRVGCNELQSGGLEHCQYVAQYGPYVIKLLLGTSALSYVDFIGLVNEVDQRATSCINPQP